MSKSLWSNKWIFILAAIGSAAGLGNLWKFPFQVYDHGGGAFIVAYLVILIVMWLSMLIWEVALWQKTRDGAPWALRHINKHFKWVGYFATSMAFMILSYYMVVLWWGLDYLYYSVTSLFSGSFAWAGGSSDFFFGNILGITGGVEEKGTFRFSIFIGTLISVILMYFFTFKSAKSVWKTVLFTATFPFIAIVILAIRWATLPWASAGLEYITRVDVSKLGELATWSAAAGQIFFTLSVAMWIMFAYGALKWEKSEIVKAVSFVAIWNTIISLLSAIAVFGTLGYLATQNGVDVTEVAKWWPSLVFVIFPEILAKLPAFNSLFAIVFFLTIFTLAIDSAMSLVEAVTVSIKTQFHKLKIEHITLWVITLIFVTNFIYMFGNGLYILDIVDHYVTQFGMLIVWIFQAFLFLYYSKKLLRFVEDKNDWKFITSGFIKFSLFISLVILIWLIALNLNKWILIYDSYSTNALLSIGLLPVLAVLLLSIILNMIENSKCKKKG